MVVSLQYQLSFRVAEIMPERTENPCVDGSIPPPGTSLRQGFGWQAGVLAKAVRRSYSEGGLQNYLNHLLIPK